MSDIFDNLHFVDLFAGIGGFSQATLQTFPNSRCVLAIDKDTFAYATYKTNHVDTPFVWGDVSDLPLTNLPPHEILFAGFPCQPFSRAGLSTKKKLRQATSLDDPENGEMFFQIIRVAEHHPTPIIILENVVNFMKIDNGQPYIELHSALTARGYDVTPIIIDAKHFLPQKRKRLFITCIHESLKLPWGKLHHYISGRIPTSNTHQIQDILQSPDEVDPKYTLRDSTWEWMQAHKAKHARRGNGFGYNIVDKHDIAGTLPATYYKDGNAILIQDSPLENPRRLTPRECARLMGFSDDFQIPVSDTQAYRQFGNAVAIPCVKAILEGLRLAYDDRDQA